MIHRRREPRSSQSLRQDHKRQLILAVAMLALALSAIFAVQPPTTPGLEVGSPSPKDVRADRTLSFTSDILTEEKRFRAENDPANVIYTHDANVPNDQRTQLRDLLTTIEQIRMDPSLDAIGKKSKLTSLPNSTMIISPELATALTNMTSQEWDTVQEQSLKLYDEALGRYDYALDSGAVTELRERSLPYWSAQVASDNLQQIILLFTSSFLKPNSVLNEEATNQRKQAARASIQPVTVQIKQGESVVRSGEIVTPSTQEKLQALGEIKPADNWQDLLGKSLLALLAALILGVYIYAAQPQVWMVSRSLWVVVTLFALTLLLARIILPLSPDYWTYVFPLGMTVLLLATLFNSGLALVAASLLSLLIAFVGESQIALLAALLLSSIAGIFQVGRGERTLHFLSAGSLIALVMGLTQCAFRLTTFGGNSFDDWLPIIVTSAMNGLLSAMLALGLYNLIGHLADVITPLQLMELSHPTQPLLRKLIREAPGTYYHSISVGNLAESAAEAIGADALLLRVAAYYHDIGKTIRPYFYTDNQSDRENVHNDLDPHTSADIICEHVTEGEKMARAARLPRQLIDFIPTHHGTSVIKHFYQLALQQQDSVNIDDYRYPGPKPRTREQAILMLSDSVEATVRSKAQNGKIISSRDEHAASNGRAQNGLQTLEELVNSIIDERIRSGQLDDCELTIHDISRIRQAFVSTLQGIYHPRVDYTPQVVKPS